MHCFGWVKATPSATIHSPAKINLFLAVTGRREDGYHDLLSVAVPLEFGDELRAEVVKPDSAGNRPPPLVCDDLRLPVDESNLVLKAARIFQADTGWTEPVSFSLTKRIPVGSGLGGGSSNGVAALRALNELSGAGLVRGPLAEMAVRIGSDCPLFLPGGPVIMRGRGERVEPLPPPAARRLIGRRVLLFKPADLAVSTAWAYGRVAAGAPASYLPAADAEQRLADWVAGTAGPEELLFNNLEPVVFRKYLALPTLLDQLRRRFGLAAGMSGSGSACFALLTDNAPVEAITAFIREAWGPECFVQVTAVAPAHV